MRPPLYRRRYAFFARNGPQKPTHTAYRGGFSALRWTPATPAAARRSTASPVIASKPPHRASGVQASPHMAELSAAGAGKRQLDTTILRAALWRVVRGHRVRLAKSLRRDQVGRDTLREQELHDVFSSLLRQDLV